MMEEINGQRDIQKLFEIILGTKVKIKDQFTLFPYYTCDIIQDNCLDHCLLVVWIPEQTLDFAACFSQHCRRASITLIQESSLQWLPEKYTQQYTKEKSQK